jgi:hypothetical protein
MKKRVGQIVRYNRHCLMALELQDVADLSEVGQELERVHACYIELGALCAQMPAYAQLALLLDTLNAQARRTLDALRAFTGMQADVTDTRYPGLQAALDSQKRKEPDAT